MPIRALSLCPHPHALAFTLHIAARYMWVYVGICGYMWVYVGICGNTEDNGACYAGSVRDKSPMRADNAWRQTGSHCYIISPNTNV